MYPAVTSSGASGSYVPSEVGSSATVFYTPPQTPRKARKMVVEVVIPIPKSVKRRPSPLVNESTQPTTLGSRRPRARSTSPARSDSSISLGTYWYMSPKKKRRVWKRKKPSTTAEGEQPKPRRRHRQRGQPRNAVYRGQDEHIATTQLEPAPPLAAPKAHDLQPNPRSPPTSPFKYRALPPSSAPRIRINLESARLETIRAQESARGDDIYHDWYHHWPTSPKSGGTKTRAGNGLQTPSTTGYSEQRTQLYAFGIAGLSTGAGVREHDEKFGEQASWSPGTHVSIPQRLSVPLTPLTIDRSCPTYPQPLEEELDAVGPEVKKLARLGLQTALGKLVERYGFPLENVSKLYHSKGCLDETERVLKQLRSTEDHLRLMTNAAFGNQ